MSSRREAARWRRDRTRALSLDQRVEILKQVLAGLEMPTPLENDEQCYLLARSLQLSGYEPVMFAHAYRVLIARRHPCWQRAPVEARRAHRRPSGQAQLRHDPQRA